ncbi:MAG: hypothetical protein C7B47_17335 [Sulfobacillus thermosulfidooxidans]|uniref:Uncharacterized protein n=1 Tax=Sulfobacillus thermosulfidooxidans TaxID=28034 RepID=A0A2T2WGJ7_SULTH|nr:MAG: hypothetical protein C7B47_17335 [Sulfobacillus thermosulfidooxidans]
MTPQDLPLLPPTLAHELARFAQMTQTQDLVIILRHAGGGLTTITPQTLSPQAVHDLCLQAARLGLERAAREE